MTYGGWAVLFLALAGVASLFAFGVIRGRQPLAAKVVFYVLVAMFVATVLVGLFQPPSYEPVLDHPRGDERAKAPGL
jgi:uncharacterized membrane protein YtjA (UPF0391 family)